LIEEQENRSKILRTKYLDVEVARTNEIYRRVEHLLLVKEEVLPRHPRKESKKCEVIMPK
jgi:hypothetical protein